MMVHIPNLQLNHVSYGWVDVLFISSPDPRFLGQGQYRTAFFLAPDGEMDTYPVGGSSGAKLRYLSDWQRIEITEGSIVHPKETP